MKYPIIDLKRRFIPLRGEDEGEDQEHSLLLRMHDRESGLSWDELLLGDAAIILGVAGSGKTTELRMQAQKLRDRGQPAFLLRLEKLCREPVAASFDEHDVGGIEAYGRWRQSSGPAVLFLDAIDEARLPGAHNARPLQDAFQKLTADLSSRTRDLKLVLSSRGSEWRGDSDVEHVRTFLTRTRQLGRDATSLKIEIVRLARLDATRIEQIAASRGLDGKAFLQAIERALAADLVSQPLEVQFMLDVWVERVSKHSNPDIGAELAFGNRTAVFESIADLLIRDTGADERRSNLPLGKSRPGIERLAAAVVLTGRRDLTVQPELEGDLDPVAVLNDERDEWNEAQVRQLLSCAVFQPSVRGRSRFAHRELSDFLASCFFRQAIQRDGGALDSIEPLFSRGIGRAVIRDDTARCLGWIATFDARARQRVVQVLPSLLIEAGDPKSLSPEERAHVLSLHVQGYGDREYRGAWFNIQDIERFASPDLSTAVAQLLMATTAPEARDLLVDLARHGRMVDLAPQLTTIACDEKETWRVRSGAAEGIGSFGQPSQRLQVFAAAQGATIPANEAERYQRNELLLAAIDAAYPSTVALEDVARALRTLEREPSNLSTLTPDRAIRIVKKAPDSEVPQWLEILVALACGPRGDGQKKLPAIREQYRTLAGAVAVAAQRTLKDGLVAGDHPSLLDAIEYLSAVDGDIGMYRAKTPFSEFCEALLRRPDVKQGLIWRRAAFFSRVPASAAWAVLDPLTFRGEKGNRQIFCLEDIQRLCEIVARGAADVRARLAFELVQYMSSQFAALRERQLAQRLLRSAALRSDNPELRQLGRQGRHYWYWRLYYRARHQYWPRWRYRVPSAIRSWKTRALSWVILFRRRNQVRRGDHLSALEWAAGKELNAPGRKTIDAVSKEVGSRAAGWVEEGLRCYWRKAPLPPPGTFRVIAALAGLSLDAEQGPIDCDAGTAAKAFVYAFQNFNSLPEWTAELAMQFPGVFCSEMRSGVDSDLLISAGSEEHPRILQHLASGDARIRSLAGSYILSRVQQAEPPNLRVVEYAIELLLAIASGSSDDTARLARGRFCEAVERGELARAWRWLSAWLCVDPSDAWSEIKGRLDSVWGYGERSQFSGFLSFKGAGSGRRTDGPPPAYLTDVTVLKGLAGAAFRIAPPRTDPRHEAVYSSDDRDHAADARRRFLVSLVAIKTEDAYNALLELASDPELAEYRDDFLYRADSLVSQAATRRLHSQSENVTFLAGHGFPPNTRKEFVALVGRHLSAALKRLRDDDDDEGRGLREDRWDEDDFRNWLSARLSDAGRGVYERVRDQLVKRSKRPDIRLFGLETRLGRISLEVKIATEEHWGGDDLVGRVKTQLVDQYMQESGSHTGFFVVVYRGGSRRWKIQGKLVGFAELVSALERRAQSINSVSHDRTVCIAAVELA